MNAVKAGLRGIVLIGALALTGAAGAQGRPDARTMSCAEARGMVQQNGAVVLTTGRHTYDRYVANQRFCFPGYVTRRAHVETRDAPACVIGYTCVPDTDWHDDRWWRDR